MSYERDQEALQRGASDFRADYEITDNPYSTSDTSYYLWKKGFNKAKEEKQSECDHDWEFLDKTKICTYPECQLEKTLTKEEIGFIDSEADGGNDF